MIKFAAEGIKNKETCCPFLLERDNMEIKEIRYLLSKGCYKLIFKDSVSFFVSEEDYKNCVKHGTEKENYE